MRKLDIIKIGMPLAAGLLALATAVSANELPHWDYEGESGPEEWGKLHEEYRACGEGRQQSPIDIVTAKVIEAELPDTVIDWVKQTELDVVNNGHAIQGIANDMGRATINGRDDVLKQFHFHAPSEHLIDGKRFPAEVHFVHEGPDGTLSVVGILLEGGGQNKLVDAMMGVAPATEGKAKVPVEDLHEILPDELDTYRYVGSLTTPPCSEVVDWNVLQTPVRISDSALARLTELSNNDARPVQPLARRFVLE